MKRRPSILAAIPLAWLPSAGCSAESLAPQPSVWTPAAISSAGYESSPSFSPDGKMMLYVASDPQFRSYRLMMSRCSDGEWGEPQPAPFAAPPPVSEADAGFTPDGRGVYFVSTRHDPSGEDFDIWHVELGKDGQWGQPQRMPAPVNSSASELLPRVDGDGRLYFGSARPGGFGQSDIYIATPGSSGEWTVRNAGQPISSAANEYEADISQDGKIMVVIADRGNRSHLFHYRKIGEVWREVGQVPARQDVFQVGPLISPRGEKLLFAQAIGDRSGEMFVVDLVPNTREHWPPQCKRDMEK